MNIKRGILGLLQIQTESGQRLEEDASGLCPVSYTVTDNEVEKVKDIKKCVINEENFSALNDVRFLYKYFLFIVVIWLFVFRLLV